MKKYIAIAIGLILVSPLLSTARVGKAAKKTPKPTPTPRQLPWTSDSIPESLQAYDTAARTGDEVDLVLNILEVGHGLHLLGDIDMAAQVYDTALVRIDTVDAKSKTAKRARSLFVPEEEKTFKGEPYERSMAFFYRGILASQQADYELARACFRSASFYDSSAAQEYEGDYTIHYWMEAKMDQLLGENERAEEVFQWASESSEITDLSPNPIPSTDPTANVILIIEAGSSPIKIGTGSYASILAFDPPSWPPPENGLAVNCGSNELIKMEQPTEDLLAQARSRGLRMADRINTSKAAFKSFTDAVGTGAMLAGAGVMASSRNTDDLAAGGAILLGGLIIKGIAASANPTADTRYWQSLPTHIHILPLIMDEQAELQIDALTIGNHVRKSTTVSCTPGTSTRPEFILVNTN